MLVKLKRFCLIVALVITVASSGYAYSVDDSDRVYFGDADVFSNPATVNAAVIFAAIPEYQQIIDRELTRDDPGFWLLLSKANEKFSDAISQVADAEGYDMVAEQGAVTAEDDEEPATDITNDVVAAL